jgi:hypothetical protein
VKKSKECTASTNGSHSRPTNRVEENGIIHQTGDTSNILRDVILAQLQAVRDGDFSVRVPNPWGGLPFKIADTFNEIVAANRQMAKELGRVGQVVGKEGRTRER